jgi:hypothetical protein
LTKHPKTEQLPLTDIPLIVTAEDMYKHPNSDLDYNALIAKPIHIEELLSQLQKILKIDWQYNNLQNEPAPDAYTALNEVIINTKQDYPLASQQANIIYDLGRKGDIMGLIAEAEKLKQNTCLNPLAEQIIQLSKDFDADAVCQLIEPFTEQSI